ncbi:TolC family protein [Mangrovimonas xylaniphaga]|uniref:TolC family protein n=1 Tax=Mangrovimonas xylaniphaga TaxID=1645915 RepID=UPI0006B42141|nr:TolC family protein [Mangrovimonas xylaniphaga]
MKHRLYIFVITLIGLQFSGNAQTEVPIAKSEVLDAVVESNHSLKISEEQFNAARADFRQTNAVFLPNITASHTGISTTNPLMAFGSKLNQEIVTAADFNPDLLNDPQQIQNFATKFEIQQPLINVDGFYQRKAAKSKMEATALQSERTKDYLTFEVDKAYMQLQLAYKGVEVLEQALEAALANKQLADNSYIQGYLQKSDVLAVEVRVTEVRNQLQTAKSQVQNASNYISFLMNTSQDVVYLPTDALEAEMLTEENALMISKERSDIKAMELASNAYETQYKADKMTFLPRLNAFGSYELYDDQIFHADASGYLFGASLSWNILEGTKRFGKAQKSRAEFETSKLQYEQYVSQSQMELNKAKRMLNDAKNRLQLSKLALDQSEESLRIRTNRFEEGLEKTTDLLMSETLFAQKQLEYYQTIFEYNYAQAYVQFLTK